MIVLTEIENYLMSLPQCMIDYTVCVEGYNMDGSSDSKHYASLASFLMFDEQIMVNYVLNDIILVINPKKKHIDINIQANLPIKEEISLEKDSDSPLRRSTDDSTVDSPPKIEPKTQLDAKDIPWLYRKSTDEYIYIVKDGFVIGKSKIHADYAIENNTSISREHCTFIRYDKLTYIRDNNSTNGTYVNGTKLIPGKKALLNDGMTIKLANEEFIFRNKR